MSSTFEAKYARELSALIERELRGHHERVFAGGLCNLDSADATGMRFAQASGHYAGLRLVLTLMEQVEKKLFGKDADKLHDRKPLYDV